MTRRLVCLLLGAVVCAGLGAQDKSAFPYVDRAKAQTLIDVLTKENETLKAEAARLRAEAAEFTVNIATWQKGVSDLVPLRDEVKARYGELVAVGAEVVDQLLKSQLVATATRTQALLKSLNQRIDDLGAAGARLGVEVESRRAQISVDEAKLVRNTDDIIVLQAALARTQAQQKRIDALVEALNNLGTKAENTLAQTVTPTP